MANDKIGGIILNQIGIVRRLDDLGRVVIPKEMRKLLKVGEGDALEFFIGSNGDLIIRKFIEEEESPDYKRMWNVLKNQNPDFTSEMDELEELWRTHNT